MGTSTNYSGSPNWGPAKAATTRAAGEGNPTQQEIASIVSRFVNQMSTAPQLGFGDRFADQGGTIRTQPSQRHGRSDGNDGDRSSARQMNGSARTVARGLGGFLADVGTKGFREALAERGLTDISGKSPDEIALALADLLGGPASLIEQTALRGALIELVLAWSEGIKEIDGFVESVTSVAQNIEGALRDFFGHYIFEVFKTVGYKGMLAKHGFEKAESMAGQIRDFIRAKIEGLESSRTISSVDWNGPAGNPIVDGIVSDTIAIFGDT